MKRLWVHEILRVYYDKLVDDSDRSWLFEQLHMVIENRLEEDMDEMFSQLRTDDEKVILIHGTDSMHLTFLFLLCFILLLLLLSLFLFFSSFYSLSTSFSSFLPLLSCLFFSFCKQIRYSLQTFSDYDLSMMMFWVMMPHRPASRYQCFRET